MQAPKFSKCPGCGVEPQPDRDNDQTLGLWCDRCGFNASIADAMHADYLVRFHPKLSIKTAADRIRSRSPLLHSMAKVA